MRGDLAEAIVETIDELAEAKARVIVANITGIRQDDTDVAFAAKQCRLAREKLVSLVLHLPEIRPESGKSI